VAGLIEAVSSLLFRVMAIEFFEQKIAFAARPK
jgi:hypothetical protein